MILCRAAPCSAHHTVKHLHVAHRLLAPALGDRRAHRAPHGFADAVGIAPARPRHALESLDHGVVDASRASTAPSRSRSGNADELDLRIGGKLALVGERQRDRDDAGKAEPPPVGDGARVGRRPASRRPCRAGRPAPRRSRRRRRRKPHQVAVAAADHLRHAARRARVSACSERCSASPCTGMSDLRPHPADHAPRARRGADGRRRAPDACGR